MAAAASLYKELQGNCALGNGRRGMIIGNPHPSLAHEGCPWLKPAPVPGWWAGVGTQALVILVSHLASPQYVLLLFSATESVCEGKQCYKAREGNAVASSCCFSLHSWLFTHQPPVFWAGQRRDNSCWIEKRNESAESFRVRVWF